ncbi:MULTISPECIES: LysM peptidoglycan-binding domain-containing protein [Bradyrhizobium]|uniref:LysM domain-containing protein n=1 Tax=Bradyrhizobium yuanmingense TaxID=108015 RepID=A0A0R3CVR5_9BRAD|nr:MULTISPECIES: LysM peptidoglycan-binding domain-containing protein [Bradyrhizobium]MCA1382432.1 LysM peptidoglycan-binding domain-containing protein [Bradyrhizobium sp. BRP05]KRQ01696.1 peptidoglycan-binding protein LysM [Bradyrhizobium yuanmingense]MCA1391717.1 LysM peptidoglycan-binding domain-containing protein [Bradyrhizobium sp. IC3123]MCA1416109.1 LysM peptidoglycan-binding domain-containing protein [Bradyrhizobium sp. NBAIM20]MCA1423855.1 LysM peptidoglycan-binding domain-containing 
MIHSRRLLALAAVVLLALSSGMAAATPPKSKTNATAPAAPPPPPPFEPLPPPKIYLFRGAMGPIFSTGMDRLEEKLTKAGFSANVYEFTICRWIGDRAISSYKESPAPIVLMGHSMGGLCSIVISEMAAKENIPISLVIAIDPAQATGDVPLNVERFINIFLSDSVLGGGDVVAVPGFRGHYASYDLKRNARVTHINIEKSDDIHRQIVEMVTQLPRIPPQTQADAVPLRYLVPADTLVELWDSGVRVPVRRGDTMESIAAANRVPLWTLAQSNSLPENAQLTPGQTIIVPRHLTPPEPAAAMATPPASPAARR